ncbi:MAG TPA: thioredoxin domain-containing protein [Terriglobia bacterium]|nr:thioredoxin domain-containing protein [Terriglobia bacterium]
MRKTITFVLTLVGLFDSLYLLLVYTSPSHPMVCLGTGCDEVRASVYSHLWGIPLPVFGVLMYATLALAIFAEPLWSAGLALWSRRLVAAIAGAGFLFSLYLTYLEGFVIHAWCAWCVVSAIVVTCIFLLAIADLRMAPAHREAEAALGEVRAHFALGVAALVVGTPALLWLEWHGAIPPAQQASEAVLEQRLIRADSHVTGNAQSPVTVVEFGDFECPACGRAEEVAHEIRAKYGSEVRFVFRQFPLARIHPYAEKAAEASECAAEQGKFWEAVDRLYAGQNDLSEPALARYARDIGLDEKRFHECLSSGETASRVRRDMEDARALGVRFTPTFFVGRRMVEGPMQFGEFAQLIDQALGQRGAGTTLSASAQEKPDAPKGQPAAKPARNTQTEASTGPHGAAPSSFGSGFASLGAGVFANLGSAATACSEEEAAKKQPALIGTEEARRLFEENHPALFVDVRSAEEFAGGHIPGALNMPVENVEKQWKRLPRDRTIVLYESGRSPGDICAASRAAGRVLLANGFPFETVKVYQDGLAAWQKNDLPVEK